MRAVARNTLTTDGGSRRAAGGFTLVEVIFVITILAFLAAVTAGGLKQVSSGNRRVACMTNMQNLHKALRLYKLDEGAYPAFDPVGSPTEPPGPGPGLWALLTYYRNTNGDRLYTDAPRTGYLGTPKSLHCPEDRQHSTYTNPSNDLQFYEDLPTAGGVIESYCSYQVLDDWDADGDSAEFSDEYTYLPDRGAGTSEQRQLQPAGTDSTWQPAADTVLFWCKWHRDRSKPRNHDLVLYLDGQVDFLAMPDDTPRTGWERLPVTDSTVE